MMRTAKSSGLTAAYRLETASRTLAAAVGGLGFAGAAGWLVHWALSETGTPKAVAVVSGTYVTWLVWCGAAMWAFHVRTQLAAWVSLAAPAVLVGLIAFSIGGI